MSTDRLGRALGWLSIALLIVAAGCSASGSSRTAATQTGPTPAETTPRPDEQPGTATALVDLRNLDELKAAFNASAGAPRLILLLSPT